MTATIIETRARKFALETKTITSKKQMTNTEELQQVLDQLNVLSGEFAEMKEDIKSIKKEVNDIGTSQALLVNDGKWIKILYGVFFSIIILLMGTLINIKS
jgi:hypothetical protein